MNIAAALCTEFQLKSWQIEAVIQLIDDGNTIPFIARYRKEAHGSLDDQVLHQIGERLEYLRGLDQRREEVFSSITKLEQMTPELAAALEQAATLAEIEDIYRPYRPKRRTRATIAKEKGLEPLALQLLSQPDQGPPPLVLASGYVDEEKGVPSPEDALAGASDIVAETISDHGEIRKRLRNLFRKVGVLSSKGDPEQESVYSGYYAFSQPVEKIAGHRVLAIDRGEKEGFLKVKVELEPGKALRAICLVLITNEISPYAPFLRDAAQDAYVRLLQPSLEREIRGELTEAADKSAIQVFSQNLHQLLMQPPVRGKVALGLDPGYRTGCKAAVVDPTGRVLDTSVIYCAPPYNKKDEAARVVRELIARHGVEIIAIGNGTASKETELFTSELLKTIPQKAAYMVVSEAGASVYSASKLAAEEFPQFDVSLRSAVSIARRLQDPLAELVKIDPKAIGVGQYQHDMPKKMLESALDFVVENCVNQVGADLNTASPSLLTRVSGISSTLAKNIVAFREENGRFENRTQLKKVPKLGPKAFEQCAGFLRIPGGKNPLDNTAVHPESYGAAKELLSLMGYTLKDVEQQKLDDLSEEVRARGQAQVAGQLGIGEPTLQDILEELSKPGRDPRDELPPPLMRTDILEMEDLKPGMELTGTVRNVIDFGAFVDIGVHQDGLVHISQITNRFIRHPSEVLKVGDIVTVWVLSVDEKKGRISLTMRKDPNASGQN